MTLSNSNIDLYARFRFLLSTDIQSATMCTFNLDQIVSDIECQDITVCKYE